MAARKPLTVKAQRRLRIVFLLVGAGLAGYALSVVMYPAALVGRDQPVRQVVGLPLDEAERELAAQGFRVKVASSREQDPTLPEGYVTWQDPVARTALPEGSQVELTVSAGAAPVTVPDIVQFDTADARRVLGAVGLAVGTSDTLPGNADPGVVIGTRPSAGTRLATGTSVDLIVSRGPAAIRVPNLVGMPEAAARAQLEDLGLLVGRVRSVSGRQPGTIVAQTPRAGVQAPRGSRIDLTVNEARRP